MAASAPSVKTSLYNFKSIQSIPSSNDLIDIILSQTQRRTPTVVHPNYKITRIREFYLRKIKTTQNNFHDKFQLMLEQFPKLEDIHPFYADLINVLYDKDHYKVALGDINRAKTLIDNVQRDYCRLMKYGDSLYRCKQLKRAALGRMATIVKRQKSTLEYLEQVRQHLSRLPSIDPNTRTLIVCGFPNVGKSSFMNRLSRAEVEVQPYAFTTKALYVGHFDYDTMSWQIIDTPGILDKPLDERNTIEMTSVTALAHLNAAVIYVMDVSQQCGHSLEAQVKLFENIKPLFANKPLRIMLNKCDIVNPDDLGEDEKKLLERMSKSTDFDQRDIPINRTSTVTGDGLMELRNAICDELLKKRVEDKLRSKSGQSKTELMDRLRVAVPAKRDEVVRECFIPAGFKSKRPVTPKDKDVLGPLPKQSIQYQQRIMGNDTQMDGAEPERKTERDLEVELEHEYLLDLQKNWDLENPEERFDTIPEIINGKNIADFIDVDIMAKLKALEDEEEEREKTGFYDKYESSEDEETLELRKLGQHIRGVKKRHMAVGRREKKIQGPQLDRRGKSAGTSKDLKKKMEKLGLDLSHWDGKSDENGMDDGSHQAPNVELRGRERMNRKRARSKSLATLQSKENLEMVSRSKSRPAPRDQSGMRDASQVDLARKKMKKSVTKRNMQARRGEGDRHIPDLKPKHLLSGKRGIGKTDRR